MKLGIFGDSYAVKQYEFPYKMTKMYDPAWSALIENDFVTDHHSKAGTSIWYSYKKFIANYKKYTHIVFCHTNPLRIQSLPDHLNGYSFLLSRREPPLKNMNKIQIEQLTKVWDAYPYLQDMELDWYIGQKIFDDVNALCKQENIKLVNVLPFEGIDNVIKPINLEKTDYSCIIGLRWVTLNEVDFSFDINKPCHLSNYNNEVLYKLILKLFDSSEKQIIDTKENKLFKLNEN